MPVNVSEVSAKVMGAALARYQLSVAAATSNFGLTPRKFLFYDRWHYYQARGGGGVCAIRWKEELGRGGAGPQGA